MPSAIDHITAYALTAGHLKPSQVYHRVRLALRRKILHRSRIYSAWCERRGTGDEPYRTLDFPHAHVKSFDIDAIEAGNFTFLNRTVSLGEPIQWLREDQSRLWVYHLHSFDYAVTLSRAHETGERRALDLLKRLVDDWIAACPPVTPVAWHAYPLSLRIINWIKAYSRMASGIEQDAEFARRMRQSIYVQAGFLMNHLEYDLLNNHLLENGRALFVAGHFFSDRTARRWRDKGKRILDYGLEHHILPDGAHNELSPMYHQIVLDLYREAAAVIEQRGEVVPAQLTDQIAAMQNWLRCVLHPDGNIPLLNDAAFKIAPEPSDALDGELASDDGMSVLPDSGLFCFRDSEKQHFLVFDGGPIGPDHQPGHGHCDALSYELSLGGQRVIVDSGVEQYHEDPQWRTFYRSTRAHNTIVIDGAEQSEIWGSFRVARRARPLPTRWLQEDEFCYVTSGHSGYLRLPGRVEHRRFIGCVDRRFWFVCDRLAGSGIHTIESLIHFHPDVDVVSEPCLSPSVRSGVVRRGSETLQIIPWGFQDITSVHGATAPIQGWYAPEFGRRFPRSTWSLTASCDLPSWVGYLLWPSSLAVSVTSELLEGQSARSDVCRVRVSTEECDYALRFDATAASLEKASVPRDVSV